MLDEMILSGLKVYAWHGVYEEEREKGQNFIINARIFYDTVSVAETDSVEDTIDYAKVSLYINEYMRVHQFNLIETVANKLARKLLIK
ncbi:MAG: dihydroneopterin aldolase, partial [Lachnospiraceae bacterium]|nr:dihydroneopterin aldolase [Lachnospiraceae bacterium]